MHRRYEKTLGFITVVVVFATTLVAASASAAWAAGWTVKRWTTGTIKTGATYEDKVDVSGYPTAVFDVSLIPDRSTGDSRCAIEISRTWYEQPKSGGRFFHLLLTNIGDRNCGTEVVVGAVHSFYTWSTGDIKAGATKGWRFNNANPRTSAYLIGLAPETAGNSTCRMEVTNFVYVRKTSGEREIHFKVANTGSKTCSGEIMLARLSGTYLRLAEEDIPPRKHTTVIWPLGLESAGVDRIRVVGSLPEKITEGSCNIQITRRWYADGWGITTGGDPYFMVEFKNVGSHPCSREAYYGLLN